MPPGTRRVAVIGAGIAGLTAGRDLHEQGLAVQVFERARGVGGRMAHKRTEAHRFDHGAQYFTATGARFKRCVEAWTEAGLVAPWQARIVARSADGTLSPVSPRVRYVGVPGMNAIAKHLARDLDVTTGCAIAAVHRDIDHWRLDSASGQSHGPFDALIVAMPPPQLTRLENLQAWHSDPTPVSMTSCWCAMLTFDSPLPVDADGLFANDDTIDWIARDSSKPHRAAGDRWVIHASAHWSASRLDHAPDACARSLLDRFFEMLDLTPVEPAYLAGHRWSFARPGSSADAATAAGAECRWYEEPALALCGDWCCGGRVEGAFLSGAAAAARTITALTTRHEKASQPIPASGATQR